MAHSMDMTFGIRRRCVRDDTGLAAALWLGGAAAIFGEDPGLPASGSNAAWRCREALGLPAIEARARQLLGMAELELGDLPRARAALAKGVPAVVDLGDRFAIPIGLSALAGLAAEYRATAGRAAVGRRRRSVRGDQPDLPAPEDPPRARRLAGAGPRDGRRGGGEAVRRGPRVDPRPGRSRWAWTTRREDPWRRRPVGGPDPPRAGDRGAGGHRADQPRDRREAVPVGAHRRGARRPRPDQARVPDAHPAGGVDARGRSRAPRTT